MEYRFASTEDVPQLARMNRELTEDENHRNRLRPVSWFEERMRGFLSGSYRAVLFERDGRVLAYALYTEQIENSDTICLRQLFVDRSCRRQGVGREVMRILLEEIWPAEKRITVGVLYGNQTAIDFYRAIGFQPYSIEMELPALAKGGEAEAGKSGLIGKRMIMSIPEEIRVRGFRGLDGMLQEFAK
ncbi:MAG: GNAT family N-acetyltransferase [Anaerolineales bacterium]